MLHSALDRAVKEKLLLHNPAEDCVVPKLQRQEMRTLKPEDMRAYLGGGGAAGCTGPVLPGAGQRHPEGRAGRPPLV